MNSRTSNLKDPVKGWAVLQLVFHSSFPQFMSVFSKNKEIAYYTQLRIKSGHLSVSGNFIESYALLFDFRVGWKSGGTGLCILLLKEIRVLIVKIGGSRILSNTLVVSFDFGPTVQSSFCPHLLGKEWHACFWARVVSFLSIKVVLSIRVKTLIFCLKSGHCIKLYIGLKVFLALSPTLALSR